MILFKQIFLKCERFPTPLIYAESQHKSKIAVEIIRNNLNLKLFPRDFPPISTLEETLLWRFLRGFLSSD